MRNSFIRLLPYTMVVLAIVTIAFVGYDVYKSNQEPVGLETSIALSRTSGKAYVKDEEIELLITGQNYGELTCESNNEKVATCDIDGTTLLVLPGEKSGSVTITLKESNQNMTTDYKLIVSEKDVVDNKNDKEQDKEDVKEEKPSKTASLSLQYAYGNITFGEGKTISMKIYGSNYGTLSCSSSNTNVATCKISGTNLLITTIAEGASTITVNSTSGKKDSYNATIIKKSTTPTPSTPEQTPTPEQKPTPEQTPTTPAPVITLTLAETSGVTAVGGKTLTTTISGENYGTLSCSTSNRNTALCAINGNELKITPQNVPGIVTLTIKEANANKTATYTVTVLRRGETEVPVLKLASTEGTTSGNIIIVDIIGTNNGTLSCVSANTNIATCSVQNNKLYISPRKDGEIIITVKENKVGVSVDYKVKVQYNYDCVEGTLTNDSTYGTICITPGIAKENKTCVKYGDPIVTTNMCSNKDMTMVNDNFTITCTIDTERRNCEYNCTQTDKKCDEYKYTTDYSCPLGWSKYSGENESLQCYQNANVIR